MDALFCISFSLNGVYVRHYFFNDTELKIIESFNLPFDGITGGKMKTLFRIDKEISNSKEVSVALANHYYGKWCFNYK